jgi:shikimate kinase
MHVYLIGFMASGKSTCLLELREKLQVPCIDLDAVLQQETGMPLAEYIAEHGWEAFRARETEILMNSPRHCRSNDGEPATRGVFACGGGIVLAETNRRYLSLPGNSVVWLNTDINEILQRLKECSRPLLHGLNQEEILRLYHQRLPLYQSTADYTVRDGEELLYLLKHLFSS